MQNTDYQENENTLFQLEEAENQNEMDTDGPALADLDFDIPSEAELFFKKAKIFSFWKKEKVIAKNVMDCSTWKRMLNQTGSTEDLHI